MKFENDKEKAVYYWEKAKYCEKNGDKKGYLYFLNKANKLRVKIDKGEKR